MEKQAQNIQDSFLNNARKDKVVLTIYLMSGVKLSGRIKSFDKYSLVLETNNQEQLIFKHAISTVVTQKGSHSYAASSSASATSAAAGHRSRSAGASGFAGGIGTPQPNSVRERAILVGVEWTSRSASRRSAALPRRFTRRNRLKNWRSSPPAPAPQSWAARFNRGPAQKRRR